MKFTEEKISKAWPEAIELMRANNEETGALSSQEFKPNKERYEQIEDIGMLKLYVARDLEGILRGYAIFWISPHMHYSECYWAQQDVMYMDKRYRGVAAYRFMNWIDDKLKEEGIDYVIRGVSEKNDYSRVLERIGYKKIETNFMRRF